MAMKQFIIIVCISLLAAPLWGADYHVAIDGSDSNPGTMARPFATIGHAAELIRPGDRCLIGAGEYYETVRPAISGTETMPISFIATEPGTATVTGTEPLTGWTRHTGNIWKISMDWSLGKNNQVFFDGIMLDEARWPDNADGALMTPDGAAVTSADANGIVCDEFPTSFADIGDWTGVVVWVNGNKKWTSWSAMAEGYNAAQKKVLFPVPDVSRGSMDPAQGGEFYLTGDRGFLDSPGEWQYDESSQTLYLIPPDGSDPNGHLVTAKRRMNAFDLNGMSYVHLAGLDILAATIDMEDAHGCMVRDIRARYISHSHGGNTSYSMGEKTGIYVSGSDNIIRDSEIAFSVADGVLLSGTRNAVINCWIHDIDYFGCYGTPVKVTGYANMASHNTIHDAGRDCIQVSGQAHLVQYNHVFHPGLIAHDLGMLYTVGNDGGGTEIHHNVFHDNRSHGLQLGLYLDNFTSNYLCHHNVVWGVNRDEIRFNKPSEYNILTNNTAFGEFAHWGRWEDTDGMFGDLILNNLITGEIEPHWDLAPAYNLSSVPEDRLSPYNVTSAFRRPGIDEGIVVPGVTGAYHGTAPDIGAYEAGMRPWRAGHDFENPPEPEYRLTESPLMNRVQNACFELSRFYPGAESGDLLRWERTGAGQATVISGPGGISQNYNTRDTYISNGVKFDGRGDDGITQAVTGLEPNTTYIAAAWLKVGDASEIRLGVRGYGGTEMIEAVSDTLWTHPVVTFTTGPQNTSATLFIMKSGNGTAFCDNVGLVPDFGWIEKK